MAGRVRKNARWRILSNPSLAETKAALRQQVYARIHAMSAEARAAGSAKIRQKLEAEPAWQKAQSILLYASLPHEVDTWPLLTAALAAGKRVALPRYDPARKAYFACEIRDLSLDLRRGQLGIQEPALHCAEMSANPLDFILVPGVAFDLDGRRLGHGKGFYDRLLAAVRGYRCGVGFDEQIVETVPLAPHDVVLDCILTPSRWARVIRRAGLE